MKKTLIPVLLFLTLLPLYDDCCAWFNSDDLRMEGTCGYESRFVYRGSKLAKDILNPNIKLSYQLPYDFSIYGGAWGAFTLRNTENMTVNQVNPLVGVTWDLYEYLTFDFGYLRYIYTNTDQNGRDFHNRHSSNQNELYFGGTVNIILSPSLYAFYNFELGQWVVEPSISYCFVVYNCHQHSVSLDFDVKMGWLHAKRFNGNKRASSVSAHKNSYYYGKVQVDVTVRINECLSVSIGPRFSANNDGFIANADLINGPYTANALGDDSETLWWGLHLNYGF